MGRFLGGILAISIASAQPVPVLGLGSDNSGYTWFGPKTVYPGFSHYYTFPRTSWMVPVACAASGNTCDTAGSGYTPTGNEVGVIVTAATVPTGMDTYGESIPATYKICNVSGTRFQLGRGSSCGVIETFSSTGSGVKIQFTPASGLSNSFVTSNTGWPSGTVLKWGFPNSGGAGWAFDSPISDNGNPTMLDGNLDGGVLRADIPTAATPGNYTINIVECNSDDIGTCTHLSSTLTFTATVTALTYLSDANEPTAFPAIPGLSTWVSFMTDATNGGGKWCNKTTGATVPSDQTGAFGIGQDVEFYDGVLSFHKIANYLGDSGWDKCSTNIAQQMAWGNANSTAFPKGVIIPNNGVMQGVLIMPIGYERTISNDARNIGVLQYFAGASGIPGGGQAMASYGCAATDFYNRDSAYAFDLILALDHLGLSPSTPGANSANTWAAKRQRCADVIVSMTNYYLEGKRFGEQQYFIVGVMLDSLIHWWQDTKDPRVPTVVKGMLDQYYSNYNLVGHKPMWDPEFPGIRCLAANTWYNSSADGHCRDNTAANTTDLANLFGHAFAWYWRISGDDTYRTEGDEVFSHEFDNPSFSFFGKTFSQAYRYSFNYVGWRQGWLSPEKSVE